MNATVLPVTEVAAFASAVRAALSDLPPDEVDELTDGLEADLSERLDDSPDAAAGLGDPLAYAEELRAAAGYPPRSARGHLGATLPNLRSLRQELLHRWNALAERSPVAAVVSFFVALRPVWWVFRGAAAYALLASFLGINGVNYWPIAAIMIVLSVQLGRGRMLQRAWVRWTMRAVSASVIVAAPLLVAWALTAWNSAMYPVYEEPWYPTQGLMSNGVPVDNVFAYDATGQPINRVQLFDQAGNPLNLAGDTNAQFWSAQDGRCSSRATTYRVARAGTCSRSTTRTRGRTSKTTARSTIRKSRRPSSRSIR